MFDNPFAGKSYLVIDDFGDMRTLIKGLLRSLGATDIDSERTGKGAVDAMRRRNYDVVLCDYNLGKGKDGMQVLEEARKCRLISIATVFVMITAESTRAMVMGAVEFEPDSYLSKPFTKELLRSRLVKLFQRKADLGPVNEALQRQDYALAIKLLDHRLEQKPRNAGDLIKLKAEISFDAGDYPKAEKIYQRLLSSREVPWARLGLGKVQYKRKQYREAKETFEYLLSYNKILPPAYDWLAKTQRHLGMLEAAQATLNAAVELSPKAIQRQKTLGDVAMLNQDYVAAEQAFDNAVDLGTFSVYKHPVMYCGLARSKSAQGKKDGAKEVVGQIEMEFEGDPVARFYTATAEAMLNKQSGDDTAARDFLEKAERLREQIGNGLERDAVLEMVRAASAVGDEQRANELLRSVVQNNHDDDDFLLEVIGTCRETGIADDPEALIQELRQGVVEMNNRGVRLIKQGRFAEAIDLFIEAADGMTGNRIINLNAVRAAIMKMEKHGVEQGTVAVASKYLDRLKAIAPNDVRLKEAMRRFRTVTSGV